MNPFVAILIFVVCLVVFIAFTVYARVFFAPTWKQAMVQASAIDLCLVGFLLAIADWS